MDIAFTLSPNHGADFYLKNNDLAIDDGLETTVFISVFTEARDDTLGNKGENRGYWGDEFSLYPLGSLSWKYLSNGLRTNNLEAVKTGLKNSLLWMVKEGIVDNIAIESVKAEGSNAVQFNIILTKPGDKESSSVAKPKVYRLNWEAQSLRPLQIQGVI